MKLGGSLAASSFRYLREGGLSRLSGFGATGCFHAGHVQCMAEGEESGAGSISDAHLAYSTPAPAAGEAVTPCRG